MRKAPKIREAQVPAFSLAAAPVSGTINPESRTVEYLFYSGATVDRFSLFEGPYRLTFSLKPEHVRMERLASGRAPVTIGHGAWNDPDRVAGVVERAWLAKDGGHAVVRFSDRPEVERYLSQVKDGVLPNISMEAKSHALEEITQRGEKRPHLLSTDWEPVALALVSVAADGGAHALSEEEGTFPCLVRLGAGAPQEENMTTIKVRLLEDVDDLGKLGEIVEIDEIDFDEKLHSKDLKPKRDPKSADSVTASRLVDEAMAEDTALKGEFERLAAYYDLDQNWVELQMSEGVSIEQGIARAKKERQKRGPKNPNISLGEDHESIPWRRENIALAMAARARGEEIPQPARRFARETFVSSALECLRWVHLSAGLDERLQRGRIIELALTSSDFPNLLANLSNKVLLPDYDKAMPTYRMLASRQDLADFKTSSVLKVGDFPLPLEVGEAGEIKLGAFSEEKDTYALATYGRRLLLHFQMLVNDDLGAFTRVMSGAAMRLADFENALWFALLTSASGVGPTLGDGVALFNAASHGNYTSSGTAIDVANLGVGRALMRKQTSLDGLKLNLTPRYLLTSPDKETLARQYTTVTGSDVAPSSKNPWAGLLEPVADANLTTANPWYLVTDPMRAATSVYGYLEGSAGPNVATRQGFEVLGVEMRVALHFGTAFVDYRGIYRNAGA